MRGRHPVHVIGSYVGHFADEFINLESSCLVSRLHMHQQDLSSRDRREKRNHPLITQLRNTKL